MRKFSLTRTGVRLWLVSVILIGILNPVSLAIYLQRFNGVKRYHTDRNVSLDLCKAETIRAGVLVTRGENIGHSNIDHKYIDILTKRIQYKRNERQPFLFRNNSTLKRCKSSVGNLIQRLRPTGNRIYDECRQSRRIYFTLGQKPLSHLSHTRVGWTTSYEINQFDIRDQEEKPFTVLENTDVNDSSFYINDTEQEVLESKYVRYEAPDSHFPHWDYSNLTDTGVHNDRQQDIEEDMQPLYCVEREKENIPSCSRFHSSFVSYCKIPLLYQEQFFVYLVPEVTVNDHHKTRTNEYQSEREHRKLLRYPSQMTNDATLYASTQQMATLLMYGFLSLILVSLIFHVKNPYLILVFGFLTRGIGILFQDRNYPTQDYIVPNVSSKNGRSKYRPSKHRRKTNLKKKTFLTWLGLTKRFNTFALKLKSHIFPGKGRKSVARRQKVKCSRKYVLRKSGPFIFGRKLKVKYQGNSNMKQTRKELLLALIRKYLQECNEKQFEQHAKLKKSDLFPSGWQSNRFRPAGVNIDVFPAFQSLDQYFSSASSGSSSGHSNENTSLGYEIELVRIGTFSTFPVAQNVKTLALAKAGFFYRGQGETVECFHCHAQYSEWSRYENPDEIHRRISPSCNFVRGNSTDNLPIARNASAINQITMEASPSHTNTLSNKRSVTNTTSVPQLSREESGGNVNYSSDMQQKSKTQGTVSPKPGITTQGTETNRGMMPAIQQSTEVEHAQACSRQENIKPAAIENKATHRNSPQWKSDVHKPETTTPKPAFKLEPLGICTARPRYPNYAVLSVRMSTFSGWPPTTGQQPNELAKAGFIFAGYGDYTRCFFCGGGLRNWEPEDDPWIEHARWFPKCVFVRQNKGDNFVMLVHQNVVAHVTQGLDQQKQSVPPVNEQQVQQQLPVVDVIEPAIQSVKEIGYSDEWIGKSIKILRNENREINAHAILEVIFGFENDNTLRSQNPLSNSTENALQSYDARSNSTDNALQPYDARSNSTDNALQPYDARSNSVDNPLQPYNEYTSSAEGAASATGRIKENSTPNASNETPKEKIDLAELHSLVEENRSLRESKRCKICLDEEISVVFVPCGHMSCCMSCSYAMHRCPICRQIVQGSIKTYLV